MDEVAHFPLTEKKDTDIAMIQEKRRVLLTDGWVASRKENMPLATIRTPLQVEDDLFASYHKGHRRYLKKARKI